MGLNFGLQSRIHIEGWQNLRQSYKLCLRIEAVHFLAVLGAMADI